jgi:demethylspheroidene O-methyltransferase
VARLAAQAGVRNGLGDRLKVHGGSFIDDELPTGADLVTLLRVAHDHDDDTVRRLLRAIHRCLPMGGSLLLAEPMAGSQGADPHRALLPLLPDGHGPGPAAHA